MVYGIEAILPIELEIPSLRINLSEQISDEEIRQIRLDQLLLLDEKCINALEHMRVYQERIKWAFDKRALIHEFEIGDLVLKENQQILWIEQQFRGKFAPNWLEPYVIKKKFGKGTYHLSDLEGNEEREPINIMHLWSFYS